MFGSPQLFWGRHKLPRHSFFCPATSCPTTFFCPATTFLPRHKLPRHNFVCPATSCPATFLFAPPQLFCPATSCPATILLLRHKLPRQNVFCPATTFVEVATRSRLGRHRFWLGSPRVPVWGRRRFQSGSPQVPARAAAAPTRPATTLQRAPTPLSKFSQRCRP